MEKTKYLIGFLTVVLLVSGIVYISLGDQVKIYVSKDKTTFYTKLTDENGTSYGRWLVSGREYNKLFDGASQMNRKLSSIKVETEIDEVNEQVIIKRTTGYIRGPIVIDTYFFDGKIDDLTKFPVYHEVEVFNASGKFYRYEVRDLDYNGLTNYAAKSPMEFGKNMKIEWEEGFNWAHVYKSGILKVQYKINSDYEKFSVRLFDPPMLKVNDMFQSTGEEVYQVIRKDGNESDYKVNFTDVKVEVGSTWDNNLNVTVVEYRTDTLIKIISETDKVSKVLDNKSYIYIVPNRMKLVTNKKDISNLNKRLRKNKRNLLPEYENGDLIIFEYQANPLKDFNLKFGENSIEIALVQNITINAILTNITSEANFTHLKIDTSKAPYNSLVLYMPFDVNNDSSAVTYDYSGSGNDGTITNATYNSSGYIGGAYDFDGGNSDVINVGAYVLENLTFSLWLKARSSVHSNFGRFLVDEQNNGFFFYQDFVINNTLFFKFRNGIGNDIANSFTVSDITNWNLITVTFNGFEFQFYLNGILESTLNNSNNWKLNVDSLRIGGRQSGRSFNGSIDEVMIFNTSLNSSQILDIYNNQSSRFKSPGTQEIKQFKITSGYDKISISADEVQTNQGSNLSLELCEWEVNKGYNTSDLGSNDGLVLYMNFDNRSSLGENDTFVADRTGINNGTVIGAIWDNSGYYDGAYEFDREKIIDDIHISSDPSTNILDNYTLSAWINLTSSVGRGKIIDHSGYQTWIETNYKKIQFQHINSLNGLEQLYSTKVLNLNEWYFVLATFDGITQKIYINGILDNSRIYGGTPRTASSSIFIGSYTSSGDFFNGSIDEVMIFNRSLSADEIKELYVKGRAKFTCGAYQNYTDGELLDIAPTTTNLKLTWKFISDNNNFYTPNLIGDISIKVQTFYLRLKGLAKLIFKGNDSLVMKN